MKKYDTLSVDFKIKKYILRNILKKASKKLKLLNNHKKRKKKKKSFIKKKKLEIPKIFEINYKTLDLIFYRDFSINHFKIANDLSPDMVQRTYRR